jgi:hypothetical protein
MYARRTALVLTALCALAANMRSLAAGDPKTGAPKKLPEAVVKILEGADQLVLASVDPGDGKNFGKELGSIVIKDAAQRKQILAALYKSVAEGKGVAKCFEPRHSISATKDGMTVEMVICFQCDRLHLTVGKQKEPTIVPISGSAEPVLNKILKDAGVKIAP